MRRVQQRARLGVVAVASFVLLVLVLPQVATGIGLGGLASRLISSGSCGSSGSSGSGSGSSVCGPPALTANPNSALVDGQTIAVTGTGFTPFATVAMVECKQGAKSAQQCDLSTVSEFGTDGSGAFAGTYSVTRIIVLSGKLGTARSVDCARVGCVLGAADIFNYTINTTTAIEFNPHSPLALRGTVAATDTVTPRTGVAIITGTVACSNPGFFNLQVELQQVYHRFNFTNYGYTGGNCTRHAKWSVTIPPGFGLFAVGKATVTAQLSGQVGNSYRNVTITRSVMLQRVTTK
jgi:hypothetical protein